MKGQSQVASPSKQPPTKGRILALDGMRGIAIILVLMSHGRWSLGFPDLSRLPFDGSQGVTFFLLLTGLMITMLLLDEQEKHGEIALKAFYARRALRLFPAYYTYLAVVAILWAMRVVEVSPAGFIASAFHWRNIYTGPSGWVLHHTWSLSMQEQFYLVWPLLVARLPRKTVALIGVATILLWPGIRFLRHGYLFPPSADAALDAPGMETILYGTLLAIAMRGGESLAILKRLGRGLWGLLLPPLIIGIVYKLIDFWPAQWTFLLAPIRNLAAVWLIWWCISNHKHPAIRILESPVLAWLAKLAYSLYLWQQLFLGLNQGWICYFPQNMVAVFVVAPLSYYLVEVPFNKLRDRIPLMARRPASTSPPVATPATSN